MESDYLNIMGIYGYVTLFIFLFLIYIAIAAFYVFCMWKIFTKASKPGWAAIVPFYNIYVLLEITGLPWWLIFLMVFVPFANGVIWIIMMLELARVFGRSTGFGVGLALLSFVFIPILAFSQYAYTAPAAVQ